MGRFYNGLIGDGETKLHSKQHSINKREVPAIDHTKSRHALSLQRSNYLTIEHDQDKIQHLISTKDALVTDPRA